MRDEAGGLDEELDTALDAFDRRISRRERYGPSATGNAFACARPAVLSLLVCWAKEHGLAARWIDGHPDEHPDDHPGVLLIEGPDAYGLLAERADSRATLYPDGDPASLVPGELLREVYYAGGQPSPFS